VEGDEEAVEAWAAVEARRHEDPKVFRDRHSSTVEGLIVDAAARESVVHCVRAAELAPADVRGFEAEVGVIESDAETAERASVLPDRYDGGAELVIAAGAPIRRVKIEARGARYCTMQRIGEMRGQYFACEFADSFRPGLQLRKEIFRESALDGEFPEFRAEGVLAALPSCQRHALFDFPDTIRLQVVKGQLRMRGPARGSELFEQAGQRRFKLIEPYQTIRTGLKPAQGVEHEQRLVRRSLVAAPPNVQVPETLEQCVRPRHVRDSG
jgi:hypothetical protein